MKLDCVTSVSHDDLDESDSFSVSLNGEEMAAVEGWRVANSIPRPDRPCVSWFGWAC